MVQIITDSGCDLPKEVLHALNITAVPLQITFEDGTTAPDGVALSGDEFYAHMQSCKKLPTTSQPSPEGFMRPFLAAKDAGDEVVVITVSAQLSGTYQCAQLAADLLEFDGVHLVDSETLCLAQGLLVQLAATLRDAGLPAAKIANTLDLAKKHLHIFAVVDNLDYLRKGGRLPATVAIAGGMLGIKPILTTKDGTVTLGGKARGLPGAYLALFKKIDALGGLCDGTPYYAAYTITPREIEPIARYFTQNLKLPAPSVARVGSVIGAHVGPGAFGFAFFDAGAAEILFDALLFKPKQLHTM